MVFTETSEIIDDSDIPSISLRTDALDEPISFDLKTFAHVREQLTAIWRQVAIELEIDPSFVCNSVPLGWAIEEQRCEYLLKNISVGGRWKRTLRQLGIALGATGCWAAFYKALPNLMERLFPEQFAPSAPAPAPAPVFVPKPAPKIVETKKYWGMDIKESFALSNALGVNWKHFYVGYGKDPGRVIARHPEGANLSSYASSAVSEVLQSGTTAEELFQVLWDADEGCLRGVARKFFPDLCDKREQKV